MPRPGWAGGLDDALPRSHKMGRGLDPSTPWGKLELSIAYRRG